MQGSFIPAFGSSSSRPFGSAHFKARREALTRVLTAGFVLPDASGSWSSAALCAHPGLIPIRLSTGVLIGRTAPEWADKISRMPGMTKHPTELRLDAAHLLDFGIAMRAAHLSQGWRGELLDLFSLSESAQGAASVRLERALYRPLGALTRAVHLSARLRDPVDEFDPVYILGQRSRTKRVGPGLWDGLAAGETPAEALLREAHEEASLLAADAQNARYLGSFLISRAVSGGWMLEASYTHDLVLPAGFEPCAADHEVERFARFSAREVLDLIAAHKVMHEAASSLLFSMAATPSAAD